jgi:hypothetical protein
MQKILEKNQLKIFDVEKIPTHGGSLRVFCTHSENKIIKIQESVHNLLKLEKEKGMMEVSYYQNFSKKIIDVINQFTEFCDNVKNEGKTIVGYGAPAKANTFLNCCRIKQDIFEYVVDLSPHKQGLYLPGSHIHIKSPDEIKKSKPDYVVIFPWNLKEEIMSQIQYIKNWGGKFVIPIPKLQIIEQ